MKLASKYLGYKNQKKTSFTEYSGLQVDINYINTEFTQNAHRFQIKKYAELINGQTNICVEFALKHALTIYTVTRVLNVIRVLSFALIVPSNRYVSVPVTVTTSSE